MADSTAKWLVQLRNGWDAAKWLGCDLRTIENIVNEKTLPAVTVL